MSELINKNDNRATIRWKLLASASALAITAYVASAPFVRAEDATRPEIWIDLGGQWNRLDNSEEIFAPALMNARPAIFSPSQKFEQPAAYGFDEFGGISFQPGGSDWVFSAAIRYGRSARNQHVNQQTKPAPIVTGTPSYLKYHYQSAAKFASTTVKHSEQHVVLDFQAGKDVGLGMLGSGSSSIVSFGVRFAQFRSKTNIALKSDPDAHPYLKYFSYVGHNVLYGGTYHANAASFNAARSFRGVGPSISWKASEPIAGNSAGGEIVIDWSANAALLFGRQRTHVQHQTTGQYHKGKYNVYNFRTTTYHNAPPDRLRSKSVTVPNVGGSIGLSWQLQDFKMSFGYKADFFFNAMDGGIDARKEENRGFFGPYASISVGLGD
jgi:hypothetical protein